MKGKDVVNAELKISFCGGRKEVNETPTMKFIMEDLVAHNANKENVEKQMVSRNNKCNSVDPMQGMSERRLTNKILFTCI